MSNKEPQLSTAEILSAARKVDRDEAVVAEREAAKARLQKGIRYSGPRYAGKTIEEWMDRADAGLASIHDIRKAFYRITPKAKRCVPTLTRWLNHRHQHFRHVAARTLGLIGPDAVAATGELLKHVADQDASVRGAAIEALGNIGLPKSEIARIAEYVRDSDMYVQRSAIDTLAEAGAAAAEAVPQLTAALNDNQLVANAAYALAAIGPMAEASVPELAKILANHEFVDYRCAAAVALGRIRTEGALEAIRNALNDRRKEVREAASGALKSAQQ